MCRPTRSVARAGFEPARLQGLSLAAVPVRVPCRRPAPLAGFEPATSTLTEWRALLAAPQGRVSSSVHVRERPAGVEPARPPWQGGRPAVTSRARVVVKAPGRSRTCAAVLPRRQAAVTSQGRSQCPRQESNLVFNLRRVACGPAHPEDVQEHPAGIEPATPVWKTGAFPATPQVRHSEARGT